MRHRISGNKLGRNQSLRKATVRDLAKATLIQQRICTTKAKAKEARKLVEKLITLGKKGTLACKRRAFAVLCDHKLVSDLFNKTAIRFSKRIGGYTRIISLGNRRGDNAHLVFLELTEKEEVIAAKKKSKTAVKTPKAEKQETKEVKHAEKEKPSTKETRAEEIKSKKPENVKGKKFVGGLRKMFNRKSGEK